MATRSPARPTTDMVPAAASALAQRPDWLVKGDTRGTENIGRDDIRPPALRLAQSGSPEIKKQEATYIADLEEGQYFNSITREVYGEGPLTVVILQELGYRHVEFAPMSEGGGVIDFNVPDGDPRTQFTDAVVNGVKTRVKPRATKFYDYLALVVREGWNDAAPSENLDLVTLSLKSTQLKKAIQLNTLLKLANAPSFALKFTVNAVPEKSKKGGYNWHGWNFLPAGWVTQALFGEAEKNFKLMENKKIAVETDATDALDPEDGGDAPF